MKNIRQSFQSIIILLGIFFCCTACQREEILHVSTTAEVQKVETAYALTNYKSELGGPAEAETFAVKEIQEQVNANILAYRKLFETRYKVSRNMWEGFPVGVIPANDACPAGSEKIRFKMDNQDSGNSSKSGWTGSWFVDGNGNSWHTLCSVNGAAFQLMTMTHAYAISSG